MTRFALIALALLAAGSTQAQVYKCVDSAGGVVYSQTPCPASTKSGTITRRIDAAPSAPQTAPAEKAEKGEAPKAGAPKTPADQEQSFRKRAQEREKSAKDADQKAAEAKRKEDNCRTARERLAQADIGRVRRITPEGERYYLDDAQLEQQKAAARTEVAQFCN